MFLRPLFRIVPDDTRIPFMKGRIAGLVTSAVLSIASLVLAVHPGLNKGIDFGGGVLMELRTPGPADLGTLRGAFNALDLGDVGLQRFGDDNSVLLRLPVQHERTAAPASPGATAPEAPTAGQPSGQPAGQPAGAPAAGQPAQAAEGATQYAVNAVRAAAERAIPGTRVVRVEAVGSRVSNELFTNGMIALGISLLAMLFYIWFRFEWQFGVAAVVTLILDATKVVGFLALTRLEFSLTTVAAILTIIGWSVNDKVVVYDRVRENLRRYKSMPLRELIDLSINETLNRTVGTSMTILLSTLPLVLFASGQVADFAWVMLFGIVIGTSSSIFIAAPILLFLGENRLRRDAAPAAPAKGRGRGTGGGGAAGQPPPKGEAANGASAAAPGGATSRPRAPAPVNR
ncbi:protein translocase subunit SecF [Roseomonas sp. NAR14]|uniref:Protein-export membrane protein SecF n=1 Tax=Roseomonas acroporae TaxID=2937791 RepID=A0A9X2BTD1_9PROT|nr:protein translocase subunit SecF [Roseomonas acroporae]MCK8784483.1 protein translocase subunit SecF [Roseomonas acroporae]